MKTKPNRSVAKSKRINTLRCLCWAFQGSSSLWRGSSLCPLTLAAFAPPPPPSHCFDGPQSKFAANPELPCSAQVLRRRLCAQRMPECSSPQEAWQNEFVLFLFVCACVCGEWRGSVCAALLCWRAKEQTQWAQKPQPLNALKASSGYGSSSGRGVENCVGGGAGV